MGNLTTTATVEVKLKLTVDDDTTTFLVTQGWKPPGYIETGQYTKAEMDYRLRANAREIRAQVAEEIARDFERRAGYLASAQGAKIAANVAREHATENADLPLPPAGLACEGCWHLRSLHRDGGCQAGSCRCVITGWDSQSG